MRKPFNFRLSEAGHKWVRGLAEQYEVNQATVFRAALYVAVKNEREVIDRIKQAKEQL